MTQALIPMQDIDNPGVLMNRATDVAGVCGAIVKQTAKFIQGRKYVQVEGWQSIAATYGCIASATKVEKVEGGVRAVGELHRISDGALLATAEGFVGEDEPTWYGGDARGKTLPKRPDYAIRAMAQTRAISRVCRSAFAFVVVLIDAKLGTTPAEEMPYYDDNPAAQRELSRGEPQETQSNNAERTTAPAGPALINADQAIAIEDRCREVGVTVAAFCKQAKIERISQLQADRWDGAMSWLDSRNKVYER